jgi:hypothetical protein
VTNAECRNALWELIRTCSVNQRYHQRLAWWFGAFDKLSKIAVGVVAIAALVLTLMGEDWHNAEIEWAIAAAVLAVAINVLPFGEREKIYDELFRCWSDLRIDAEVQDVKLPDNNEAAPCHATERLVELLTKQHSLNAKEAAPIRWLLRRCQADDRESIYGKGIRTAEQVCRKFALEAATSLSSAAGQ